MSNKNTDWLIDFYQAIADAAPPSHAPIENFSYTFKFDDIARCFPTIEDVGYSPNKTKQLERHYWNASLNPFIYEQLNNGATEFSFSPQGLKKKHGDNKNKDFCLSNIDVKIVDGTMSLVMRTRASEPFQILLADLWFFNSKMRVFAEQFNLKMGTFHFDIGLCKVYSFSVRSPSQIRIIKDRTPEERADHFIKFINCFYAGKRKLAFRIAGRFLTFFLPEVNPTPTYSKLKIGHNTCHKYLDAKQRTRLKELFYEMFPTDIKTLQSKRDARGDNKFPTLLKD